MKKRFATALFGFINRFKFLRRANTQTWLLLTNLFFWFLVLFIIVGIILVFSLPAVRQQSHNRLIREAQILDQKIEQKIASLPESEQVKVVCNILDGASAMPQMMVYYWNQKGQSCPNAIITKPFQEQKELKSLQPLGRIDFTSPNADGTISWNIAQKMKDGAVLYLAQEQIPYLKQLYDTAFLHILLAIFLLGLMAYFASWVASYKIVEPLKQISHIARHINEGHLEEKIMVTSQAAELQDLAENLNKMALRFRQDIHEWRRVTDLQNEFIGNVSHEVKNPIFSIGGYLEALGSANLTPAMRQMYVNKGLSNLQRLNNLFSDLIEIARLEYKEGIIRPEMFNLQALIDEVAEELEPIAKEKNIVLLTDSDPIQVYADRSRIRQVFANLLQNAVSYTEKPDGTVQCHFRRHGDKVLVEVIDTGRGIPEEHLERIFERFYRVDAARSRAMGGTGLGLSIVKQILQAHNQEIKVESTLGHGTRFWFELPLHPTSVPKLTNINSVNEK